MKIKVLQTYYDKLLGRPVLEGEILDIDDIERVNLLLRRNLVEEIKTKRSKKNTEDQ